jgi:hypothetical protein
VSITDYGATAGRLCTEAIQKAIDAVAGQGGGTVLFPAGTWVSGTVHVKSGVTLHLVPSAVLRGSTDIADYTVVPWQKNEGERHHCFIVIDDREDVLITGGGTIEGNGFAFWDKPAPEAAYPWYRAREPRVNPMIHVAHSRRITFDNIRISDSPGWTVHLYCCDGVIMRGVTVDDYLYGPNTDGFDINGCRDVFVSDCRLTCGDDAIIIKATPEGRSCERIMISNCRVESNCIGIGIGQETLSDVRQVTVSNCIATGCHRMFAIGMWEGGIVEDVTVCGLVGDTLTRDDITLARPIQLEAKQHATRGGGHCTLRNVQISNVVARTKGRILMTAQGGMWLENVMLRDIRLSIVGMEDPELLSPATGTEGSSQYANRNLEARKQRAAVVVENARGLVVDGLYIDWPRENATGKPFAGIWARGIRGGYLNIPLVNGLDDGGRRVVVADSDCRIEE